MIIEKTIVDTLRAACAVETWFGAQPQSDDEAPSRLPVVIVNRIDSNWLNDFAGLDEHLALVSIQVDYYAETAEAARRLADLGRIAMKLLAEGDTVALCPTLENESSFYDTMSRGWRVIQEWLVNDYEPALP